MLYRHIRYLYLAAALFVVSASEACEKRSSGLVARATPEAPHFVVYSDRFVDTATHLPPAADLKGYTVFVLSFLRVSGPVDQAAGWAGLSDSQRSEIKSEYEGAGIKIIVSLFGDQDAPTSHGDDPAKTADTMADWVLKYGLDGVDVDYEDFAAMNGKNKETEAWIVAFTKQLRQKLPVGTYIVSHAPIAPWFSPNVLNGVFLRIHKQVGDLIDWYNVQFYNQGNEYSTCDGLLNKSGTYPNSALFQIAGNGVPLSKIVIGKPASKEQGSGFVSPTDLAVCLKQASKKGWNGGVMVWEYSSAKSPWITGARSSAFAVPGRRSVMV